MYLGLDNLETYLYLVLLYSLYLEHHRTFSIFFTFLSLSMHPAPLCKSKCLSFHIWTWIVNLKTRFSLLLIFHLCKELQILLSKSCCSLKTKFLLYANILKNFHWLQKKNQYNCFQSDLIWLNFISSSSLPWKMSNPLSRLSFRATLTPICFTFFFPDFLSRIPFAVYSVCKMHSILHSCYLWIVHAWAAPVAQQFSSALSPGPDPGDPGSSPTSGSLHGACFSLCLCLCPPTLMNKYIKYFLKKTHIFNILVSISHKFLNNVTCSVPSC